MLSSLRVPLLPSKKIYIHFYGVRDRIDLIQGEVVSIPMSVKQLKAKETAEYVRQNNRISLDHNETSQ